MAKRTIVISRRKCPLGTEYILVLKHGHDELHEVSIVDCFSQRDNFLKILTNWIEDGEV